MHSITTENKSPGMTFKELVEKWRPIHFLKLELSTQQTYERRLPLLSYLNNHEVESIDISTIDWLITKWVEGHTKNLRRFAFTKELDILKVILRWYRTRISYRYMMPVLREHYSYANVAKKAKGPVQTLSREELHRFLRELKRERNSSLYAVALAQFSMGLRIGETLGLHWDSLDLKNKIAKIERTIVWDLKTWKARVKERPKNGQVRVLVMPEFLVEELRRLEAYRDPNVPLVFHFRSVPLNRQSVAKSYNRVLKRLGFSHVHGTHWVRKSAATLANEITGDYFLVSHHLGHQDVAITKKYIGVSNNATVKVAQALNSVLQKSEVPQTPPSAP